MNSLPGSATIKALESGAASGGILVPEVDAGKKLMFAHHSDATLKGFDEPVALFEVGV